MAADRQRVAVASQRKKCITCRFFRQKNSEVNPELFFSSLGVHVRLQEGGPRREGGRAISVNREVRPGAETQRSRVTTSHERGAGPSRAEPSSVRVCEYVN